SRQHPHPSPAASASSALRVPEGDYLPLVRAARAAAPFNVIQHRASQAARVSTRLGEVGGPQAQAPSVNFITPESERRGPTGGGNPAAGRRVRQADTDRGSVASTYDGIRVLEEALASTPGV